MVKVSVEVIEGSSNFRVSVQAQSIQRAQAIAAGCYPECRTRVIFPIEADDFFVGDAGAEAGLIPDGTPAAPAA